MSSFVDILKSLTIYCIKIWLFPFLWVSWLVQRGTFPTPYLSKKYYEREGNIVTNFENWANIWLKVDIQDGSSKTFKIPAFHVKGILKPSSKTLPKRFTVLFSHGNGSDIYQLIPMIRDLFTINWQSDFDIFCYDYPGYSLSRFTANNIFETIKTSEKNVNRAAEVAWTYLVMDCKIPPDRIILVGRSIGCGPTIHLASTELIPNVPQQLSPKNAAALVLISSPLSTMRVFFGKDSCILPFVEYFDIFQNHEKIREIHEQLPVVTVHAMNDKLIPFNHMIELENSLPDNKNQLLFSLRTKNGGHNFTGALDWENHQYSGISLPKYGISLIKSVLRITIRRIREDKSLIRRYTHENVPVEELLVEGNNRSSVINAPVLKDYGRLKRFRCFIPWLIMMTVVGVITFSFNFKENTEVVLNVSFNQKPTTAIDET